MSKIGRNEPCPCGSGKKYKKCCMVKEISRRVNEFDPLIREGNEFMQENKNIEACQVWLKVWESLKLKITPEITSIEALDEQFSGQESLYNWCQDLEMTLGNAGIGVPAFNEKRILFCREFIDLLPDSDELVVENMRRAEAESYFSTGRLPEGEKTFQSLVNDFPDSPWVYVGWGDMYGLFRKSDQIPLDYEKAAQLYQKALQAKGLDENDRKTVLERLADLEAKQQG